MATHYPTVDYERRSCDLCEIAWVGTAGSSCPVCVLLVWRGSEDGLHGQRVTVARRTRREGIELEFLADELAGWREGEGEGRIGHKEAQDDTKREGTGR